MSEHLLENILVVKLGGSSGLDLDAGCDDLAALAADRPLVIVHGVSALANQLCQESGHPTQTIISPSGHTSRYTDPVTRGLYVQAAEMVNGRLIELLRARSVQAAGLTGHGTAIHGTRKAAVRAIVDGRVRIIRDDYSGSITSVDTDPVCDLLRSGCVPVLPPMAISPDGLLNIDGDRAAAAVASALSAAELVILSNVRGLYRSYPDESSLVPLVPADQLERALNWAQGRMKRKVIGAQEALAGGVQRVIVGDGRLTSPVQRALSGQGTVFAP